MVEGLFLLVGIFLVLMFFVCGADVTVAITNLLNKRAYLAECHGDEIVARIEQQHPHFYENGGKPNADPDSE